MDEDERRRIAAAVYERTMLTLDEVGDIVDRSGAWVKQAVDIARTEDG